MTDSYEDDSPDSADAAPVDVVAQIQLLLTEHDENAAKLAVLKDLKERQQHVLEVALPELLTQLPDKRCTLPDGTIVSCEEKLHVGVNKEHHGRAMNWLEEQGHEAILRHTFTISFGVGEGKLAQSFARMIAKLFPEREIQVIPGRSTTELCKALDQLVAESFPSHAAEHKITVHPSTLRSLIKKLLKKQQVPDCFKVYNPNVTTIVRPDGATTTAEVDPFDFGDTP